MTTSGKPIGEPPLSAGMERTPVGPGTGGSGLVDFCRTLTSSIATAVTVTPWTHRADYHRAAVTEYITLAAPAANRFLQQLQHFRLAPMQAPDSIDGLITREAPTLAINDA